VTAGADTKNLIVKAVEDLQAQVPALAGLKLVTELELRGRGDVQLYRVEVGGPGVLKVTKDIASDAKVRVSIPRAEFNELVEKGQLRHWHEAFDSGIARAVGPPQIVRLIQAVVAKQEERDRLRRARTRH
jgi:hypothetical protein